LDIGIEAGRDSRKLIRMYNKMAKTLVEFETLWYQVMAHIACVGMV
jgi:hypothetical protein